MATLVEQQLSDAQLKDFCERVRTTPGAAKSPTILQRLMVEAGVISPESADGKPSKMAATAFRDGPLAKYIERIERSREISQALVDAAKGGAHGLDAIEEAMVIELQDHLAQAEEVDLKFLTGQLLKLRMSISMREESRRKQTDLERKQRETEAKLELAEKREALYAEQIAKLTAEREERVRKNAEAKAALTEAKKKSGLTKETLAAIEEAARLL
jgi:predicted RNA-binding protein with RPS1 domain